MSVEAAYAACDRMARGHYENFPVASHLLPRPMRPHIAAIYAFARAADDFADEGDRTPQQRLALLDDWLARLRACAGDGSPWAPKPEPTSPVPASGEGGPWAPKPEPTSPVPASGEGGRMADADAVFLALASTIRVHRLPVSLFEDLISAFRQDVTTTRYDTWEGVLDYCRRSANPVGRLVLRVAGSTDDRLDCASDAVCTALQLTNFWQDVDRDWQKGRLYVPRADCQRFGAREEDLAARRWTAAWRLVLADMACRTRRLFDEGQSVCDGVSGRLRYQLRFTWLGGRRILDRLERAGFDVFTSRPALGLADVPALAWQATAWRRNAAAT